MLWCRVEGIDASRLWSSLCKILWRLTKIHNVVAANSAVIDNDIPGPQGDLRRRGRRK